MDLRKMVFAGRIRLDKGKAVRFGQTFRQGDRVLFRTAFRIGALRRGKLCVDPKGQPFRQVVYDRENSTRAMCSFLHDIRVVFR